MKFRFLFFCSLVLSFFIVGCNAQPPVREPTYTPTFVPTGTPTSTLTLTPTFTPTPTPTPTATRSPIQIAETSFPTGYTLYDTFDVDAGKWKITKDSASCFRNLENGTWKFECFGANERVTYTMLPSDENVKISNGVSLAFYTLPVPEGKSQWGKYQILLRFGSDCGKPQRDYVISIRPNELQFIEADSKGESINPPSPKRTIGTGIIEPHIIRLDFQDGLIHYYLDNEEIRSIPPVANTLPVCWMFQSQDNNKIDLTGYRGIVLLWVAVKP